MDYELTKDQNCGEQTRISQSSFPILEKKRRFRDIVGYR
jgi:hypothetical protein